MNGAVDIQSREAVGVEAIVGLTQGKDEVWQAYKVSQQDKILRS